MQILPEGGFFTMTEERFRVDNREQITDIITGLGGVVIEDDRSFGLIPLTVDTILERREFSVTVPINALYNPYFLFDAREFIALSESLQAIVDFPTSTIVTPDGIFYLHYTQFRYQDHLTGIISYIDITSPATETGLILWDPQTPCQIRQHAEQHLALQTDHSIDKILVMNANEIFPHDPGRTLLVVRLTQKVLREKAVTLAPVIVEVCDTCPWIRLCKPVPLPRAVGDVYVRRSSSRDGKGNKGHPAVKTSLDPASAIYHLS